MEISTIRLNRDLLESIEGLTVEYPYVLHRVNLKTTRIPWHWHEEIEFFYVREGRMWLRTAGRTWQFGKGEGFFVNTNVMCSMGCAEDESRCLTDSHVLHKTFLGGHFKSVFETKYLDPVLKNRSLEILELRGRTEGQQRILARLREAASLQDGKDTEFQTRNLFSEIWLLLLGELSSIEEYERPAVDLARQERLQTMLAFIWQNYQRRITLDEIAAAAHVGGRECLRCFQSCMQKTPFEYLLEYRTEMSKRLLRDTQLSVMEVAAETGFSSAAYYGKIFRRLCGMTPGAYRRQEKLQAARQPLQMAEKCVF